MISIVLAMLVIMILAALLALPFTRLTARGLKRAMPKGEPDRPGTFLETALLRDPAGAQATRIRVNPRPPTATMIVSAVFLARPTRPSRRPHTSHANLPRLPTSAG